MALAVSGIFQISLLLILLYKKIGDFRIKEIFESCIKILASSILLGFACYFVRQYIAKFVDMQTFRGIFSQAALASIAGVIVFIASAFALKSPEIKALKTVISRKINGN